jgi:hypothetical protein
MRRENECGRKCAAKLDPVTAAGIAVPSRPLIGKLRELCSERSSGEVAIKVGSDGTFGFLVHDGLSYIARASFWDEAQREQVSGTVGPFVVRGDMESVKVVLSPAR